MNKSYNVKIDFDISEVGITVKAGSVVEINEEKALDLVANGSILEIEEAV